MLHILIYLLQEKDLEKMFTGKEPKELLFTVLLMT